MTDTVKKKPELHVCPSCGVTVKSLSKHQAKAHDPVRLAAIKKTIDDRQSKEIAESNRVLLEKARTVFVSTLIKCGVCREKVELRLLPDHYSKAHNAPLPLEMRALYGLGEAKNLFKSAREREAYWRQHMGAPIEAGSDIYDRKLTVQGGAYGLGKNRKH
jgi:hypothetical protein